MKLLIPEWIIQQANDYTNKSYQYTHNHSGWEDEHIKKDRILGGKIAELFILEFLKTNGVLAEGDGSKVDENDKFDFTVNGKTYDVKSTKIKAIQATKPYEKKPIDFFIGCIVSENFKIIEILGVVKKEQVILPGNFVKHGQLIPGTKFNNKFKEGSYFYTSKYECFYDHFEIIDRAMPVDYWRRLWLQAKGYLNLFCTL
jgi:hypothetical protein